METAIYIAIVVSAFGFSFVPTKKHLAFTCQVVASAIYLAVFIMLKAPEASATALVALIFAAFGAFLAWKEYSAAKKFEKIAL